MRVGSARRLAPGGALDIAATEALPAVIVDNAVRLHPGVHDDRADKLESSLLERLGHFLGERSLGRDRARGLDRTPARHAPDEVGKILPALSHGEVGTSVPDR